MLESFAGIHSFAHAAARFDEGPGGDDRTIENAFGRIANVVGLTDSERETMIGDRSALSRMILALETLAAALDILRTPEAAAAWLRAENAEAPFDLRSPLQTMAAGGQLGVEITLLYLRAPPRADWSANAAAREAKDFGKGARLFAAGVAKVEKVATSIRNLMAQASLS